MSISNDEVLNTLKVKHFHVRNVTIQPRKPKISQCQVNHFVFFREKKNWSYWFSARAYDYGRKTQTDYEEDDGLGINSGSDYFTRGEGSQNFTFGGRTIEERAPRDDDDDEESEEDEDEDDDEEDTEEDEEEEENEESTDQHEWRKVVNYSVFF